LWTSLITSHSMQWRIFIYLILLYFTCEYYLCNCWLAVCLNLLFIPNYILVSFVFSVKISYSCSSSCLDLYYSVVYFCIFFSSLLGLLVRLDLFSHWCGLCPLDWHSVHINAADGRRVLKAKIHFSQGGFVLYFCWFSPVLLHNSLILKSNPFNYL